MEFTNPWRERTDTDIQRKDGACPFLQPKTQMDGERKQQENQRKGNVVPFLCFIKHHGPSPQAANQIRGLSDSQPMDSRDLVTGISCGPKVWVIGAELVGNILLCEWSVQLSVTLQISRD